MFDRKIIAQNITNLTDARYFAAWGVDYLSFNLIPGSPYEVSIPVIEEIREWVEGPRILTESNAIDFTEITDGHILNHMYSSLPLSKEAFYRIDLAELKKGLPSGNYILQPDEGEMAEIKDLDPGLFGEPELYLDIVNLNVSDFHNWPHWHLAVQGGEEEKTGVKSFDDLDELYDMLMDEK